MDHKINIAKFVRDNYIAYNGDSSFLTEPTERTKHIWNICKDLLQKEFNKGGLLDLDIKTISRINSHEAGYIDPNNKNTEIIVGLQTDQPLKRAVKPHGGIRVTEKACEQHGYTLDPKISNIFRKYCTSHNDGVFHAYTKKMRQLRKLGVITGLPDNYARGRIIGDYRRIALFGVNKLIEEKQKDYNNSSNNSNDNTIRLREEITLQIGALKELRDLAKRYGFDIAKPANNSKEVIQWTYFAYLAAVKEHDGAAMSLGSVSAFFDIFIEHDLKNNTLTENTAQELIDQFVIKLRLVRHLRPKEYNDIFAGDPTWVTEAIGGCSLEGKHKITKTAYRFLQTLYNLGPSPEPNLTILWSKDLPENFKKFAAKVSIDTSSIQFENDDLMREEFNTDDYGISCCVSHMELGKTMQFFGARCNIGKAILMAINGGRDEVTGELVISGIPQIPINQPLDLKQVKENYNKCVKEIAKDYVDTMNVIHYMHDKYYYERLQMALIDTYPIRNMAFGIAGLSVVADSFSAIKFAKVTAKRTEKGISTGFMIEGEFPKFGNDDDKVDSIAQELITGFQKELEKHQLYKNAIPTLSVLTITSNVLYGKKTGATPDGRKQGEAFAPGANPMHGRDTHGAIASLNSVAKLPYKFAHDGISNTFSFVPSSLGATEEEKMNNLVSLLDGYFSKGAHHLNVNVLDRETLKDAMVYPEKYPQLTIRISGYAVNFIKLSREQQEEVLARTFHEKI
ncbi:formate acetyltransferase [archaeon]|nr:formate acetyltransferase [archaeon]